MRRLLMALLLCVALPAQEEPLQMVRSRVEPEGPVMVGQPVRLIVDVLVSTWLTGAPQLPRIEIPGAVVVLPEERALNLTERSGGTSWFGVSRSYVIYPQQAGEFVTPEVSVVVKYGGGKDSSIEMPIPAVSFSATIPAAAANLGYFIPTTKFQITQRVEPEPADLKVGDSIQRTVTMMADGTFAMFLPPVAFDPEEGLAVYAGPPRVEDLSGDRQGFQGGRRIDSASYVIQRQGQYSLPGYSFSWWDLEAGHLREAAVPPIEFKAAPAPDRQPEIAVPVVVEETAGETPSESWLSLARRRAAPALSVLAGFLALLLVLRRVVPAVRRRVHERRRRYEASERAAFAALERVCASNDRTKALRLLYVWLDRMHTGAGAATLDSVLHRTASERLHREARALMAGDATWDGSVFYAELNRARRALAARQAPHGSGSRLSTLNPI